MSKFQRSRPSWLRDPEREYKQAQDGGKWQGIPQKCSGSLLPKVGGWRGQPFSSSLEKGFQRQHLEGREHLAGLICASRVWGLVRDICLRSQVWEGGWSGLRWQSRRPDRTKRLLAPSPRGGGGAVKGMWTLGIRNASLGLFKQVLPKRASAWGWEDPKEKTWMEARSCWKMLAAGRGTGTARVLGGPRWKVQWGVLKKATEAAKREKGPFTH